MSRAGLWWRPRPLGRMVSVEPPLRQAMLHPGEDGWWAAECPSLPGCLSQGKTKEEAIANIRDAIAVYVQALEQDGIRVPP